MAVIDRVMKTGVLEGLVKEQQKRFSSWHNPLWCVSDFWTSVALQVHESVLIISARRYSD